MNVQKNLAIRFFRTKLNLLSLLDKRRAGQVAFRLFCTPLSRYTGKPAAVFSRAEALEFELNGKKVRGYRCNPSGIKKVLILHGFASSCHKFEHYVIELINKNYEVLAFDAPAHGASDGNTVNALDYSNMAQKVVSLYGPVEVFFAHSFGGMAICLALEHIPHSSDTKLVLIAPATETTSAIDDAFKILGIRKQLVKDCLNAEILRISGKDASWYSIRRAMKDIRASVLWVHDKDDNVTPVNDVLKVQEDNLPHVRFVITTGLGHRKIYHDAVVKRTVLDFLSH